MVLNRPETDAGRLIRSLIRSPRRATAGEIEEIISQIATAPFDSQIVRVPVEERGAPYGGITLGARADAPTYHLVKRVLLEQQWRVGTTVSEYLADLGTAVLHASARLAVYTRRGGNLVVTITPTEQVVPAERRGPQPESLLLVVYSVDRGTIITGYQSSDLEGRAFPRTHYG